MIRRGVMKKLPRSRVALTLLGLSKAALADIIVDMARGSEGDDASDEVLLQHIGDFAAPTLHARGDRVPEWCATGDDK